MTAEEAALHSQIKALQLGLRNISADYTARIAELKQKQRDTSLTVNSGKRRLITAQGDELRDEVAIAFRDLGFSVRIMDNELSEDDRKKEDLRIRDSDLDNWEAIVEVRGHKKSSGQPSDLGRLSNFARLYKEGTGKYPDMLIYVVNGQIEIQSPQQRQVPFAADPDLLKALGEQQGLVMWTVDLYKLFRQKHDQRDLASLRNSIRASSGRWIQS
jgi:hypothetical protein